MWGNGYYNGYNGYNSPYYGYDGYWGWFGSGWFIFLVIVGLLLCVCLPLAACAGVYMMQQRRDSREAVYIDRRLPVPVTTTY